MTYEEWLEASLVKYNELTGENRTLCQVPEGDYDPGDLVEFSEEGNAYPHGIGGVGFLPHVVPPFAQHSLPSTV